MSYRLLNHLVFAMTLSLGAWLNAGVAQAHEGHGGRATAQAAAPRGNMRRATATAVEPPSIAPVHGGQLVEAQSQYFEVVFLPHETRIYVYAKSFRPLSPREGGGEVLMQVRGNPQVFRYPLRYAAQRSGTADEEYLVADVDVTRVRDGDMQATFSLTGLPAVVERTVKFTHTFALARGAAVVTRAQITAADREGVARQGTCPVMESGFDHGDPIKLMVGNQALYVCCEDCIDAVKKDPQAYLQKVAMKTVVRTEQAGARPRIAVTRAAETDRAAIQAQALCPVMNKPLGAHGVPWKMSVNGNGIFVCCAGCIRKVQEDPQRYLAGGRDLKSSR